jgi:glucose/arabinose dehydrogenase
VVIFGVRLGLCAALGAAVAGIGAWLAGNVEPGPTQAQAATVIRPFASGFDEPVFVTNAGDGSGRIFVVEKKGAVWILDEDGQRLPTPFLDKRGQIGIAGERGLLSIAFPPGGGPKSEFHAFYTMASGDIVISRFAVSPDSPNAAGAETVLVTIPHPGFNNHNGGQVAYAPDGSIYFATGDGGGSGDPNENAENPESQLGKLFRIPPGGSTPEMVGLGLRNPYRFSIDGTTMYLADVGQNTWEEVNIVSLGSLSAAIPVNFGWDIMEGNVCHEPPEGCDTSGLRLPDFVYAHEAGRCSIIGGYVYRGTIISGAQGTYVYGDYCSGEVFGLGAGLTNGFGLTSFGLDEQGELYLTDQNDGTVNRIEPEAVPTPASTASSTSTGTATGTGTTVPGETVTATPAASQTPDGTTSPQPPGTGTPDGTATGTPEPTATATPTPTPTPGPFRVLVPVARDGTD